MKYSGHIDSFALDNLPPEDQMPEILFTLDSLIFPERLNCAVELIDKKIEQGFAEKIAIKSPGVEWTYLDLFEKSNQIANVLCEDLGLISGNRVLLRGPNTPMLAASWLGVIKAGGIVVTTMPLLRAHELEAIVKKASIKYALCDSRLLEELSIAQQHTTTLSNIVAFGEDGNIETCEILEQMMLHKPKTFKNVETAGDDIAIIAFTSGTTGHPKGAMHFHTDVMSMCVCVGDELVKPAPDDIFIGSPPLAFTFGLGMQLVIPLYAGATTVFIDNASPDKLANAIEEYQATVCATAPTAYRAILNEIEGYNLRSLKKTISAGEPLPVSVYKEWKKVTGIKMIDGLGATEMIHIFVSSSGDDIREGAIGKAVNGYQICILDDGYQPVQSGQAGHLAVKGPTGCKYLTDSRQKQYVINGWNITGDTCEMDEDGYIWFKARSDDMIISAGYNISPFEVETALMTNDVVAECAVVGVADKDRGQIVKAFVVPREGFIGQQDELEETLKRHVKAIIAPYKYPRKIEFLSELPRTNTGKIQRFMLRG